MPAVAQDSLTNTVTVTPSSSVVDGTPGNNTASAIVDVSAAADYNFCPAGGTMFAIEGLQLTQRVPHAAIPELTDSALDPAVFSGNALMIDPVRNRLLYVARGGGQTLLRAYDYNLAGWYTAATLPAALDPKAGAMTVDGVGYLLEGGASPAVWRVDLAPNGNDYVVTAAGSLAYDHDPAGGDPADIAFDAGGVAWLVVGDDMYTVDLGAGSVATRRQATLTTYGSAFESLAFSAGNQLYMFPGGAAIAHGAYNPAAGNQTTEPVPQSGGSDGASCALPVLAPADLAVTKTLAEVNGAPYAAGSAIAPGDTLAYNIRISNSGGIVRTMWAGDVVETLPQNTTPVAAGNDFACAGTSCPNTTVGNAVAGGNLDMRFLVQVDSPLPVGTSSIDNAVEVATVDCAATGNDCIEVTPLAPSIIVSKASDVGDGTPVAAGDTITYTITVAVANSATGAPVQVTDTLGSGLAFGSITSSPGFTCGSTPTGLQCTLPTGAEMGNHDVVYTATVETDATTSVSNSVTTDTGTCASCTTTNPLLAATSVVKASDPATGTAVLPTSTIEYTLTVTVANAALGEDLVLEDTLGAGLEFGNVIDPGSFTCSGELSCTLPAGTGIGTYAVTYIATVESGATGSVANSVEAGNAPGGDPDPTCTTCATTHPIVPADILVTKSANPAAGTTVAPMEAIEYTLTVTVTNSALTQDLVLEDTLGAGLEFDAVTSPGSFICTGTLICTLPAATTGVGTHSITYRAIVDADATGSVANSVVASNAPGGDPDPSCATCSISHPIVPTETTVTKTADPATGETVLPGDIIEYTLTVDVAGSTTSEDIVLVDTLGAGLTFGAITSTGAFTCTGALACALPAGAGIGSYSLTYTATVDPGATGTVANTVVASNPPGGDPDPTCASCTTEHNIEPVAITVVKSADPAAGTEVRVGDTIGYTVAVTVANSATSEPFTLTDTLGPGLDFGDVTDAGAFTCSGTLECELPAGTLPGLYEVAYTATVGADAEQQVRNLVAAEGGGGDTPDCSSCSVEHLLADPKITISKSSNPASGAEVRVGDAIEYTLTALVENASTLDDAFLVDDPGVGLDIETLPAGCTRSGNGFRCALPAGTAPGTSTFTYTAIVNADAGDIVVNLLTGESQGQVPECEVCEITHKVIDETSLRITKAVSSRTTRIGDILRYTLTIENVGARNFVGGTVLDTPPAGFSYVEGSMSVADGDGAFNLAPAQSPLRIGGLDIPVGEHATVAYLLRVGAGVRQGVYVNEAVAVNSNEETVSNVATAQVLVDSDPLLDDSLVFGTVFDDRDADGWQDSAGLDGVHARGGFNPEAYIPGTTTVDRGQGPVPQADASAPLLHGIDIGAIAGRESIADTGAMRQVVIRQRLHAPTFTDDFVLTSDQGLTLRMDAEGNTSIERDGDAAKGIGAGEPVVERSVARVEDGYEVAYTVGNTGIDERGIPGVRLASVEGLLIETDHYGRYHLADVQGGEGAHGRNFILKVDPATLPAQTVFTTDNPIVRRITPGMPVRLGFGVQLPVQEIPGSTEVLELQLGEVFFAPNSAELRPEYLPAIAKMAEQVDAHGGGEVVITAEGGNEPLAFARAEAVRDALVASTGEGAAAALTVALRTRVDDPHSMVAMLGDSETLLATVLFDTDRSTIRPEFEGLLDSVAKRLEEMGGGVVGIVGHTDVRASHAYNTALGLRRAQSVFDALVKRLGPTARAHLRVESSNDPNAPLGTEQK
ncbi:MAG: OmpA family protein [Lysobacter sp.]